MIKEENNSYETGEGKLTPMDPNSEEFQEVQFYFNTIFNDTAQISAEQKIYNIDKAYSVKNQYISLNFEKRQQNEITAYGWYLSETTDDKKFVELVNRLQFKGQDRIGFDINVSAPTVSSEELRDIFICKFIIGECYIQFQGEELEKSKEEIGETYDTIVKILDNKTKKYEVLKPENLELLALLKIKYVDFEQKTIQCGGTNCKMNEQGADSVQPQDKKICYCLLTDSYLCKTCHSDTHQNQILFGEFGTENCEHKPFFNNYQGECINQNVHPKNEPIEFFSKDYNRGICSYCRFSHSEKYRDLQLITTLFSSCTIKMHHLKK